MQNATALFYLCDRFIKSTPLYTHPAGRGIGCLETAPLVKRHRLCVRTGDQEYKLIDNARNVSRSAFDTKG